MTRLLNLQKNDFVLEIGSGHNPRRESHVLCDKFLFSDEQRGAPLKRDRPLVIADGHALPFRDKQFDYVICSHVLEHVQDPCLFLSEIVRVANRGYIETPSEINERLAPKPYHLWYISVQAGKLLLKPKQEEPCFRNLFHYLYANDECFRLFHHTHPEVFLTRLFWERELDFALIPPDERLVFDTSTDEAISQFVRCVRLPLETGFFRKWIGKIPGVRPLARQIRNMRRR